MVNELKSRIRSAAFAFRGYNTTNLGRSRELLLHHAYGPTVENYLAEASEVCRAATGKSIHLAERVRRGEETSLESYHEAVALVVAMGLAQIRLLEDFFDVPYTQAQMAYGYSLGELTAVIASGVMEMKHALSVPLAVADDCVALADDVTMGVLFSRGPVLDVAEVERLCLRINTEGQGIIAISSHLAPNTVLLLGQGNTLDRFAQDMHEALPARVYLRKNPDRWPPMHTPLVWERYIPNRAGILMHTTPGGFSRPEPPLLSLVTGDFSYNDYNCREILNRWIDHPQRLWDAVYETLASGVDMVIHVGPDPNLIPATFHRITDNVNAQLAGRTFNSLGLRAMSHAVRRPWLSAILPSRTALLRAPLIEHVILEDWLLAQKV